jgi:hypothetical protein
MFISRFMIQILHTIQNVLEGKRRQIKRGITVLRFQNCVVTNLTAPIAAFVFPPSVFWEKFTTAEFK